MATTTTNANETVGKFVIFVCERILTDHRSFEIKNKHEKLSRAAFSRGLSPHAALYWQVTEFCLFWFGFGLSYDANKQIDSIRGRNEGEIRIFKTPLDFLECFEAFYELGCFESLVSEATTFPCTVQDEIIEESRIEVQGR